MIIGLYAVGVTAIVFISLSALLLLAERFLANYGECLININDGSVMFEQTGGVTLLSALYNNKIFIPSACGGKGYCGFCKVMVKTGGGPVLPTETPFMSRSEIRAGVRLACQVKIKEGMEIFLPEDVLNVKEFRARVSSIKNLTHDIKEVTLELVDPTEIKQRPGQYIQILAPSPEGPVYRAYSVSTPSHITDKVQLVVRIVPGGIASTYIHGLNEGEEVSFTGPYGEFQLAEDPDVEVICVGGGAGMAPIANIIRSIYHRWPDRRCHLFFGCRSTRDIFYLDKFQALAKKHPNFRVTYALSDPLGEEEEWDGDTGFIHLPLDKYLQERPKRQAFLCGPPPMIEAVTEVLKDKKVKSEEIFYDKF